MISIMVCLSIEDTYNLEANKSNYIINQICYDSFRTNLDLPLHSHIDLFEFK